MVEGGYPPIGEVMIQIVNISEAYDPLGVQTYEVRVNRTSLAVFQHKRSEGLAECLRKAAGAVTEKGYRDLIDLMEIEREDQPRRLPMPPKRDGLVETST
jgi:hypothetical protein